METATSNRLAENKENSIVIKDAQDVQTAVTQALQALREFYGKANEAAFLQMMDLPMTAADMEAALARWSGDETPPSKRLVVKNAYKGLQGLNEGVCGMLEVILSDYAKMEAEVTTDELFAQKSHDEYIGDSKVERAEYVKDVEHKTKKKLDQEETATEKKGELRREQDELDIALKYYEKLKPDCVHTGRSYEERVKQREAEIKGLQNAYKILHEA